MNLQDFSLRRYRKRLLPLSILLLLVILSARVCGVSGEGLRSGIIKGYAFLGHLFPPDWAAFPEMIGPAFESVVIALLATFFGVFLSLCFALAAAANISYPWLRSLSRAFIAIERSLPEIIIVLILVAAFGLGPVPGMLALTLGCIGMLGKLFADAIEEIDIVTIEAIEAVGANKGQVIVFGVLPQIMPRVISYAMFRFEINIRLSVLLGAVGAGGIGYELDSAFNLLQYHRAFTALIVTLLLVFIIERLSGYLRKKIKVEGALK